MAVKESLGEKRIREILQKEDLDFKQEYTFPALKSYKGKPLRFDFAVFKDNKLFALIEYQGQQHYEYVEHFSKNKVKWQYAKAMDRLKRKFVLLNGLTLYSIPYTELNNLHTSADLFNSKFLVTNIWHDPEEPD